MRACGVFSGLCRGHAAAMTQEGWVAGQRLRGHVFCVTYRGSHGRQDAAMPPGVGRPQVSERRMVCGH